MSPIWILFVFYFGLVDLFDFIFRAAWLIDERAHFHFQWMSHTIESVHHIILWAHEKKRTEEVDELVSQFPWKSICLVNCDFEHGFPSTVRQSCPIVKFQSNSQKKCEWFQSWSSAERRADTRRLSLWSTNRWKGLLAFCFIVCELRSVNGSSTE